MTAEVAVLNKMAVALAADSTVTISSGEERHKTFESADKLFELSLNQPVGIMFYGNGQFMGMPIAVLVKTFRDKKLHFATVQAAMDAFLDYLTKEAKEAPAEIKDLGFLQRVRPILNDIVQSISDDYQTNLLAHFSKTFDGSEGELDPEKLHQDIADRILDKWISGLSGRSDAFFKGGQKPESISDRLKKLLLSEINLSDSISHSKFKNKFLKIALFLVQKNVVSQSSTGLVIAGFGASEKLPSLCSCTIDGLQLNRLKYRKDDECDVDRLGTSAAVYSFAQRDVMDRFLFGFDSDIQDKIQKYTKASLKQIMVEVFGSLETAGVDGALIKELRQKADASEQRFVTDLEHKCFKIITAGGKAEIEDMIRFMPKPELAQIAESLINLTSMKRRVSKGMETVGGPVDVAVISKSEGFVWVRRKHYFPAGLNSRYFDRNQTGVVTP